MASKVDQIKGCPLLPKLQEVPGRCALIECNAKLPKGRRKWCSNLCSKYWLDRLYGEHDWGTASHTAVHRDKARCVKCSADGSIPKVLYKALEGESEYDRWKRIDKLGYLYRLEVNHIEPRAGKSISFSCRNHVVGLETLCHACHVKVTAQQRKERANASCKPHSAA